MEEEVEVEGDDGGTVLNAPSPDQHWSPKDDEDDSMEDVTAEAAVEPKRKPVRSMAELAAEAETVASERDSSPPPRPTRSTRGSAAPKSKPTPTPALAKRTSLRSRQSLKSSPQISDSSAAKKRTRKPAARRRGRSSSTSEEEADEESSLSEEAYPVKKTRTLPPPKPTAPTLGRTLRARRGKTEEQIREEREQERAYRRAIED